MYEFECPVCNYKQEVEDYGDFECQGCSLEWIYEEGHCLKETDELLDLLRKHYKKHK